MKKESESMEFTGERFVPEVHGNIELEHLHRYLLACKAVAGKTVLDIASGEGYGSAMLARTAHKVTGVDISQEAISHAQAKYQAENLEFHLGSCSAIPLGDASVDVVVSFETIEHHGEHEAMMREIKRVLRPGGVLVISSPDKLEYSDKPGYSNPHHVKELFTDEFECLLKKFFGNVQMLGQRVVYGSLVVPQEPTSHYSLKSITTENEKAGLSSPIYDVAVASDTMLPELYGSLFEMLIDGVDAASYLTNAIVQRDALIDNLGKTIESIVIDRDSHKAGVAQLQVSFEKLSHERDEQVSNLYRVVADRDALVANLGQTVESLVIDRDSHKAGVAQLQVSFEKLSHERDEQVSNLYRVVADRDALVANLGQTVESLVIDRDSHKAGVAQLQVSFEKLSHERDEQVSNLYRVVADRDALVANLGQTVESLVIDRDSHKAGVAQLQVSFEKLSHERDEQVSNLYRVVADRDALVANLGQTVESLVIDRDSHKAGVAQLQVSFEKLSHERDEQVSNLYRVVADRDALVANLGQTVESLVIDRDSHKAGVAQLQVSFEKLSHERDEQVSNLYRVVADRDALVANLGQTVESLVIDRDSHKAGVEQLQGSFEKLARERDEQVSQLNRVVAERDNQLEKFKAELSAVYKSKSWHLTSPLRWLVRKITRTDSSVVSDSYECPQMKLSQDQQPLANVENEANVPTEKTDPKFRILLVSYYCPTRAHAGGLRILDIYALIRHQCPNVQIDLLTYHRPSIDWSLDDVHRIFHNVYLSPTEDLTPEVLLSLRGSPLRYDVIDLQFHQSGYQIDAFRRIGSKIIFTPMESLAKVALINLRTNFLTISSSRLLKMAASLRLAAEEVVFALKADEVVCVSRADAAILRAVTSSRRVHGMDTGVSQFEFAEALAPSFVCASAESRRCNVLYLAYFGSETNVSALRWYLDKVHPIIKASVPGYVLTVVGRGDLSAFSSYRDDSIAFVGEVAALAPSIQEARIGIAPALAGSGLRGKVNQYAILGVPSVVSPIAHKGLVYQDGENIFVAEKPEVFAERCIRLLTDLELNDRMGQAARELCLATYSWQSKWPTIRKIYNLGKEDVLHVAS